MTTRIEFCGIPASGKSTLCDAVLPLLQKEGKKALGRTQLISQQLRRRDRGLIANTIAALVPGWREALLGFAHGMDDWVRFAAAFPKYTALAYEWIAQSGLPEEGRKTLLRAIAITAYEHQLGAETHALLCLDEGFYQRFFSLRGYSTTTGNGSAMEYVDVAPRPDVLIWVNTPPETCRNRIQQRERPPLLMPRQTPEQHLTLLQNGAQLLDQLSRAANERKIPTLIVSGDQEPARIARAIADFVEKSL